MNEPHCWDAPFIKEVFKISPCASWFDSNMQSDSCPVEKSELWGEELSWQILLYQIRQVEYSHYPGGFAPGTEVFASDSIQPAYKSASS